VTVTNLIWLVLNTFVMFNFENSGRSILNGELELKVKVPNENGIF